MYSPVRAPAEKSRSFWATPYLALVCLSGFGLLLWSFANWQSTGTRRFLVYLTIALAGSCSKVTLRSLNGTMSANFLFVLIGIAEFSLPETLTMACLGIVAQSVWHSSAGFSPIRVSFNTASIAVAGTLAYSVYHWSAFAQASVEKSVAHLCAATVFFAANTLFIAGAVAVTEGQPLLRLWRGYFWSFPVYLMGSVVASIIGGVSHWIGWQTGLLILPVLYAIHSSHKLYVDKLAAAAKLADTEREHALATAALQLRTVEALALAIEAKDGTTFEHLERVQVYAVAVGRELGLGESDLEALRAAAILHDIGKIAVPDYIISKPGRLTPVEFDKMKIHPVVGAQIVEQVQFPYPVAPIVRAHHEKWDGTGYPSGLKGEEIPIGARILMAVDVLDALASDRQYRKALPLPEAMAVLERDAGKMFDPTVVAVLSRRYVELEQEARERIRQCRPIIQTDVKVERGDAPDAGFEASLPPTAVTLRRIQCRDICVDLATRAGGVISFDALGVFVEEGEVLYGIYASGEGSERILNLEVPRGQGLIGWVAENHMAIVNGNPGVEPGLSAGAFSKPLLSALAVPAESQSGAMMVVCVYSTGRDAFNRQHLELMQGFAEGLHTRAAAPVAVR